MDIDRDTIRRRSDSTIDTSLYRARAARLRARTQRAWLAGLLRRVRSPASSKPKPEPQRTAQTG